MKLTKKHIGKIFNNIFAYKSWIYQLVDIKREKLLFYSFNSNTFMQSTNKSDSWRYFKPVDIIKVPWGKHGWEISKPYKTQ